jgi:ribosomal protein L15
VSAETLKEKKILKIPKSLKKFQIKILGQGNLTKPLIFDYRLLFSEKAKEKIENSGSKIQ